MTRQQQNAIIMSAFGTQLKDTPNVQESVGKAFSMWFAGLAEKGLQLMTPPPAVSGTAAQQTPPGAQPAAG